jgi:transposase
MARVEELTRKMAELSDALGERRKIRKPKKPTGRKRGAQKGHKGHHRKLVPADQVDEVIDVFPELCEMCLQAPPRVISNDPSRVQVVDILEKGGRHITEYRLHTVECDCGASVTPSRDQAPRSAFGSRLKSIVSNMTGGYQLSRRQVPAFLNDTFGIEMSLGSVSNIEGQMSTALAAASDEAMDHVEAAAVKHIDETSWVRDFDPCSLWVIACAAVSVFRIVKNGRRATLLKILQPRHRGILVSDRASVFLFWSMKKRQVCWSHLQRAFVAFSQRDGPAGALGGDLVTCAELLFGYWRQYRSGALSRERFEQWMEAVRKTTKQLLEQGANAGFDYSGSCANMLKHWDAMWTFVETPGVEPSNNQAERELRRLVMWRRRCFGTQSERGDRFVERMMTVTHTLRKQGRRVLSFLQESLVAMFSPTPAPGLIAAA